jgi:hypothetical protein
VFPVVALALAALVFYCVEAHLRKTPWVFTDELEWTQLSRSIAATGHAARRGEPIYFKSIYAYLIAPFWRFHTTTAGYAAVKYANAVIMCLAAIPTFLLARMLVSRRNAAVVGFLSICVPAMAYVTSIIPEVLAYPYFALCSWLAVRALRSKRRLDVGVAAVFLLGGYFVRQSQFTVLPAAGALAAGLLWFTGPRGRALRRNWTKGDKLGAALLVLGALFLFNRVVLQHVHQWQVTTQLYKNRMVDLGLRAGLSFTIGLGVLPVIGGLASLRLPERRGDPTYRAYVAWTASAIALVSLYTSVKAAYLSTIFSTLWEERNMIYLSPLLLIGTAMVLEAKRLDRWMLSGSIAFVSVMVAFKAIQTGFPYFEAPGSAIPAALTYYRHWTPHQDRLGLVAVLAVSVALLLARRRKGVAVLTAALTLAWVLSGEILMTVGVDNFADAFRANLPAQLNWVDQATGGAPTTFLGQEIRDPNGVSFAEFWNHSIDHVDSMDATAPGPGPTTTPNIVKPDGLLGGFPDDPYVVAANGVTLAAPVVARQKGMLLYKRSGPSWHLLDTAEGVYSDGWCSDSCAYTYFKPDQAGTMNVVISRSGYGGPAPAAKVTVDVGTVEITPHFEAELGRASTILHRTVASLQILTLPVHVAKSPVRVEIHVDDATLIPPTPTDSRSLGVQVGFRFVPDKPASAAGK